ncbi:Conserved_hypothetical protein [Hexamita inflata]|uniref:Transmembrane protein n=1 Tax=Hexamita inflata TaxID=28002 RepID=A0AA86PJ43_9EUKA|nr:Conserved hypothetical protein [Hexamita inflata]
MLFTYVINDLLQNAKLELSDCYSPSTNIKILTLNGQRSFRIFLDPTKKKECSQLPRGVNVTIYATALIDGSNNFIPNSMIVYDFSYATTVGITVPCTQCSSDTYFSSDQVIITIESAIHYTRVVMGAVQTERGLQGNCFKQVSAIMDTNLIVLQTQQSGNCPQLISSGDPLLLKNVIGVDLYIIYENGDIDRYEKLTVGTQATTLPSPPSSTLETNYSIAITNIGAKAQLTSVQFIQLQLSFDNAAIPMIASVQTSTVVYSSFAGGFIDIQLQGQTTSAYIDIQVNDTIITVPGFTGKLSDYYNYQIFNVMMPDKYLVQIKGFSTTIPSQYVINQPFVQQSIAQPAREAIMTFTVDVELFGFQSGRYQLTCDMVTEKESCKENFARLLSTQDPNYQVNFQVLFYKNNALIAGTSSKISRITDSCVSSATGLIQTQSFDVEIFQNVNSKNCGLKVNQIVTAILNLTEYNVSTRQTIEHIMTFTGVKFDYKLVLPITNEQKQTLLNIMNKENEQYKIFELISFTVNGKIVEQVGIDAMFKNDLSEFDKNVQQCIIAVGVVSVVICAIMILIPIIVGKVKPIIEQKKKIKQRIVVASDDL